MRKEIFIALAVALFANGAADAASRQAMNRCNDAVRDIKSGPRKLFLGKDINPLAMNDAMMHARQVMATWKNVQARLASVPKEDLDWKDPQLKECHDEVKALQDYITELKGKLQGAKAGASTLAPFLAEVKPYERSLYVLAAAHFEPTADAFNGLQGEAIRKIGDDMAAVEKACDEMMPDAGKNPPTMPGKRPGQQYKRIGRVAIPDSLSESADSWCWLAKHRAELSKSAAGNKEVIVEGYSSLSFGIPDFLKRYSAENAWMEAWMGRIVLNPSDYLDKLRKKQAANDSASGVDSSAGGGTERQEALIKQLQAKVDEIAPRTRPTKGGGHDSALEKEGIKALKSVYRDATIVSSQMTTGAWSVEKNALGVPLSRNRSGEIVFSLPGQQWCLERSFSWVETYSGGGNYEPPDGASIAQSMKFLACP